jgi:putative CocE/NonD family hydrolase
VCRLDLRGTGSSEGIAIDEYHPQEQADICEVIAWLAAQEWSTGKVGMYGTSWGGFNSIQVAMERPPALHAYRGRSSAPAFVVPRARRDSSSLHARKNGRCESQRHARRVSSLRTRRLVECHP